MGISLNTNMMSLNIADTFNKNTVGLQSSMEKLSTGMRINSAGDDPSGMGISGRIRTRIKSVDQANMNLQNDSAILKIADNALSNMADIVSSIKAKVVQAADNNVGNTERAQLQADVTELITQYTNVVTDAKYGGKSFFLESGYASDTTADQFTVQYGADSSDKLSIQFSKLDTTTLGISSIAFTTATDANGKISTLDGAINKIATAQVKLGNHEQRLGYLADNTAAESLALQQLDSSIRDQDVAQGMTEFMRYNIRTQTSQLMLAQAGQVPAMVLKLLEP